MVIWKLEKWFRMSLQTPHQKIFIFLCRSCAFYLSCTHKNLEYMKYRCLQNWMQMENRGY
jgi:hypothetical protein